MLSRALFILLLLTLPAKAEPGAFFVGRVEKVVDGDTIRVVVDEWPLPFRRSAVRIYGIDTAESKRRNAKCKEELWFGEDVAAWLRKAMPRGSRVKLQWMGRGDKFTRLSMRVFLPDGRNVGRVMIEKGFALPYMGGRKPNWCDLLQR